MKTLKRLIVILSAASALLAQNPTTAAFPTAAATDNTLFVAANNAQTTVTLAIGSSDTTLNVASTSTFIVPAIISIDTEYIAVCSKTTTTFTVCGSGRGYEGSSAATHALGVTIYNFINAHYFNQVAAEIKATEKYLIYGANPNKAGTLFIYPPPVANSAGTYGPVVAPNGTFVNCVGTTTACLNEAFTYAANNGLNIHIVGGDELKSPPGNCSNTSGSGPTCNQTVYYLTGTWTWPTFQGQHISCGSVIFGWPASVGAIDGTFIDSLEMVKVDFEAAQFEYGGSGLTLHFAPTNQVPLDNSAITEPNILRFGTVGGNGNITIKFDTTNGSIAGNIISIDELNCGNGSVCISVPSPGNGMQFRGNFITAPFIHNFTNTGIDVGSTPGYAGTLGGNHWDVGLSSAHTTARGIDIFSVGDIWDIAYIDGTAGASAAHIFIDNGADFNQIRLGSIGTGPLDIGSCSSNVCPSAAHSIVQFQRTKAVSSITVGSSPFAYENLDFMPEQVCVSAGTVSAIAVSPDNSTYMPTGQTAGCWQLAPGDFLKVTYSGVPTIQKSL